MQKLTFNPAPFLGVSKFVITPFLYNIQTLSNSNVWHIILFLLMTGIQIRKKQLCTLRFTPQNGVNTLTPLNEGKSQKTGFINHLRQISAAWIICLITLIVNTSYQYNLWFIVWEENVSWGYSRHKVEHTSLYSHKLWG